SKEMYDEQNNIEIKGVEVEKDRKGSIEITNIKITDDNGSRSMGKPKVNYITLEVPGLRNADAHLKDEASLVLAHELSKIIQFRNDLKVLVVGLGNDKVTPDALGPLTVEKIKVTRHYFITYKKEKDESMSCVSALIPGVMGTTGIETVEIIKGAVDKVKPDLIIAIDALAARRIERINTTIQITDTGISPGAGVGNNRTELNGNSLGARVIAIGVPTVIDSFTVVFDTIEELGRCGGDKEIGGYFNNLTNIFQTHDEMIDKMLQSCSRNMIVTANDIDSLVRDFSQIISNSINMALHPGLKLEDVNRYMS
ncbi:MAG: GPR endopeptidase, partial [Clostridiaceae bacterium]|nr:GPR endopeptidase [Clostridiaceae bacterium]